MKTVDFSETIAACDLKVGRFRQLIEIMKVCKYWRSRSFSLPYIFPVLYVLCFTRPRAFTGQLVHWLYMECLNIG